MCIRDSHCMFRGSDVWLYDIHQQQFPVPECHGICLQKCEAEDHHHGLRYLKPVWSHIRGHGRAGRNLGVIRPVPGACYPDQCTGGTGTFQRGKGTDKRVLWPRSAPEIVKIQGNMSVFYNTQTGRITKINSNLIIYTNVLKEARYESERNRIFNE